MKIAVFNTKPYDREFLKEANTKHSHELVFFEPHLTTDTCKLAFGFEGVCVFINDQLNKDVLTVLAKEGVRLVVLRCAGFNNVDLNAAADLGIKVMRVPAYSPHGVSEHTIALILALNRKIPQSYNRVRDGNFSLEGLMGFDLYGQTVGVVGTGKIGSNVARIMRGFGARVLAYDPCQNPECASLGVRYVSLPELFVQSDIITLHAPLTPQTRHMINEDSLKQMKLGIMIINTSRGGLVDTVAVIKALKSGKVGYLGLDVYEEEGDLFFENLSGQIIQDDIFTRLLTFPNVIITGHQAFFTRNALKNIADTTLQNITDFHNSKIKAENEVSVELLLLASSKRQMVDKNNLTVIVNK